MSRQLERLRTALVGSGVIAAYLFGSRARGEATEGSDLDVAVLVGGPFGLLERERLADRLAAASGVAEVDVVVLDTAPLELRGRVVREGRLLYSSDEPARVAFHVRTLSEYFDFLPTLEGHTRRYLRQVARRGL